MTQQPDPARRDRPDAASPPAPPSGWAPMPLSSGDRPSFGSEQNATEQRDRPLSAGLPAVKIDEFAPPRSRLPLLVIVIALAVAGLIWAGTAARAPQPAPTPTHSASPSPTPTASGLPFVTPDQRYTGRWEILRHQWTDSGLEVEIRVAADRGPVSYSFLAFGNNDLQATSSEPGSQDPKFTGVPIASGSEETGWLFFPLDRGATTIILATASGNQMSALPVAG